MSYFPKENTCWLLIPAAGVGRRMNSAVPKQYLPLRHGRCILDTSISRLLSTGIFTEAVVAISPEDKWFPGTESAGNSRVHTCLGGEQRSDTVLLGLRYLLGSEMAAPEDWVMVHDAVRPCVSTEDIARLLHQVQENDEIGGILAAPVTDTLKRGEIERRIGGEGDVGVCIAETVDRSGLWRAMTPQMFRIELLIRCLEAAKKAGIGITDEASALEIAGYRPLLVKGRADNIKITVPEDLPLASWILSNVDGGLEIAPYPTPPAR